MASLAELNNVIKAVGQSPPVDTTIPYDASWVAGKTILITGGVSGFGQGFFRKWAENGANVIIGDVNDTSGRALIEEVRETTGNPNLHYIHCDVTNWQSQVDFFRTAAELSPTKGIDAVVANAGIVDPLDFHEPRNLDAEEPPKPNLKCLEVNLVGVLYTAHLALFYLPRNPKSEKSSPSSTPGPNTPDRHLLLIGSVASLLPIPFQSLYATSKHGVLGLFRSLRHTSFTNGIRINMLCPYYIATPLVPVGGRLLVAGSGLGETKNVVDAGTRLMADTRIVGRALVVGPKVPVDENMQVVPGSSTEGHELAVWDAYADDLVEVDAFNRRFIKLVNTVEEIRGWAGLAYDVVMALTYPLRTLMGIRNNTGK